MQSNTAGTAIAAEALCGALVEAWQFHSVLDKYDTNDAQLLQAIDLLGDCLQDAVHYAESITYQLGVSK